MEWGREIEVNGVRPAWLKDDATPVRHGGRAVNAAYWGFDSPKGYCLPADHWAYRALDAGLEPWGGGDAAPEDWDGGEVLIQSGRVCPAAFVANWRDLPNVDQRIIGYRKRAAVLDWSKPLEHTDGTPLEFNFTQVSPDNEGDYYLIRADRRAFSPDQADSGIYGPLVIRPDGTQWGSDSKRVLVRNRALPAAKQPEGDTVTIRRMTEAEARLAFIKHPLAVSNESNFVESLRRLGIIREETPAERFARETGHEVTPAVEAALAWGKAA